jgi:hypothetical protein
MEDIKISIIGGGLSAIYSYFGCIEAGYEPHEIEILHNGFSKLPGAIFMYESPIPWMPHLVLNVLLGTCEDYAYKQWGNYKVKTSAHIRFSNGQHPKAEEYLYDPHELLPTLWGMMLNLRQVEPLDDKEIKNLKKQRKAVICTFSSKEHRKFYQENGYLQLIPVYSTLNDLTIYNVIYNGMQHIPWIRQTIMPGRTYVEYPHGINVDKIGEYEFGRDNDGGTLSLVPDLTPDCPPLLAEQFCEDNLIRVGRFAVYDPKYLSHFATEYVATFLRVVT